ncbi:sulfate transporter CysZ [Spongorhabdus nitratireducens]
MSQALTEGVKYFITGIRLLPKPGIRAFVILPLLANLLVFSGMIYYGSSQFSDWMSGFMGSIPGWLSFLEYVLWPIFALTIAVAVFFLFTIVANLIAAPFNGLLAERIQQQHAPDSLPQTFGMKDWMMLVPRSLSRELQKIMYYLPRALLLLVLTFIPVINLITPILWFLFSAWMLAIQYCDFAADNQQISFKAMLRQLKDDWGGSLGLGICLSLAMLIPGVNLILMPAAVIAGSLLWCQRHAAEAEQQ